MNDWLQSDLALRLGYTLLHSLWQGIAVCTLAATAFWLLRRASAASRHAIALLAVALMLALPAATFAWLQHSALERPRATAGEGKAVASSSHPDSIASLAMPPVANRVPANAPGSATVFDAAPENSAAPPALTWRDRAKAALPYAAATWLAGVLAMSLWNIGGWLALQRLRFVGTHTASERLTTLASSLQHRLGLARPVRILESVRIDTPALLGFFKPLILFPPALAAGLSTAQLEAIVAHELAHVARWDYPAMLFQRLAETILFYHPGIWWLSRRASLEREQACDDIAATLCGDRHAYASALGTLEEMRMSLPAVAATGGNARELMTRIARLLGLPGPRTPRRNGVTWGAALASLLLVALMVLQPRHLAAADKPQPIVVTVKELTTGKPVPGATVNERGVDFEDVKTTDQNGIAMMTRQANPRFASVSVKAAGWASVGHQWTPTPQQSTPPDTMDFVLEPAKSIGGIVEDETGKPLANAKVMAWVSKAYPGRSQSLSGGDMLVETDADGKWTIPGIPATFDTAEVGAAHADCLDQYGYLPLTAYGDHAALSAGTAKFTLHRGVPVNIIVHDEDGKPAPQAKVGFGKDRVASNVMPEFDVDADGKLRLGIARDVDAVVTVYLPGHAPELKRFHVDKESTLEFDMKEGKTIHGRVIDQASKGIAGASIFLDTWRGARTLDQQPIRSDADGWFTFDNAPNDEISANIQAPGYLQLMSTTFAFGDHPMLKAGAGNIITMKPQTIFTGTVVDAATGQPIADFKTKDGIDSKDGRAVNWFGQHAEANPTGKPGEFQMVFTMSYPAGAVLVEADGYKPMASTSFDINGTPKSFTFKLEKVEPFRGKVVNADGQPMKGQEVLLISKDQYLSMDNGDPFNTQEFRSFKSSDTGEISFVPDKDPYLLLAVTPDLQVLATSADFEKSRTLVMRPWARIEGDARNGTHSAPSLSLETSLDMAGDEHTPRVLARSLATTDSAGHFVFDHVLPGTVYIMKHNTPQSDISVAQVEARPDETTHVQIGGKGMPVSGHIDNLNDPRFNDGTVTFASLSPMPGSVEWSPPVEIMEMPLKESNEWRKQFDASDEGKVLQKQLTNAFGKGPSYDVPVASDGTFRLDDVLPGIYRFSLRITRPASPAQAGAPGAPAPAELVGALDIEVTVPEAPGGVTDTPLDLGTIALRPASPLKVGDALPAFKLDTLDGKTVSSDDLKGKVVLVVPWMTRGREYLPDVALLKDLAAAHRDALTIICFNEDFLPQGNCI